jgi:paraquat-inducible protein B
VSKLLGKVELLLDDVHQSQLPEKAATTLVTANNVLLSLQSKLDQLKVDELSRESTEMLKNANVVLLKLNKTLERIDGDTGLVASVQRTSDSLGDVTGNGLDQSLNETLRALREAAVGIRRLVEALERDPEMLIKGKGRASP